MNPLADSADNSATEDAGNRLQQLLSAFGQQPLAADQVEALALYCRLLLRWNAKINLTAIRDQEGILRRHFVESILCARLLPAGIETLLDYGSGGGFPGIPCAVCRPGVHITLAESQGKKASFLREIVRTLNLNASVHHGRVEEMDANLLFGAVTLRAVDRMGDACKEALLRLQPGGWIAVMSTRDSLGGLVSGLTGVAWRSQESLVGSDQEVLLLGRKLHVSRQIVPRGTI